MRVNYPLYKNIGVHVISSLFTVDKGTIKVLLVKRSNEPFKDMWALPGGALYNNETLEEGISREIYEKSGLKDIKVYKSGIFDSTNRSPVMRMIAISYVGVIDINKVTVLKKTSKIKDSEWVAIDDVKELAYDHNIILEKGLETLKDLIVTTDILKNLFPSGFTIPEVQKTYEIVFDCELYKKFNKSFFKISKIKAYSSLFDASFSLFWFGVKFKIFDKQSFKNLSACVRPFGVFIK